ncbi:MAG: 5-(carboxyamino)imidazole ribonucleotide synthase [Candidatus Kapaibacterium sp.]
MPTLGILGGGQLARMTAIAAFQLGLRVHIMERFPNSPAGSIAQKEVVGDPSDHELLKSFAAECDVVTLESEFINEGDLAVVEEAGAVLYPSSQSVGKIQDKLTQKETVEGAGIPVAPFRAVATTDEAVLFGEEFGYPFVLKSRRGGYDGYGNATIRSREDIVSGWEKITGGALRNELYCEAFVHFTKELALMVTRGVSGEVALYPVVETVQKNHICHTVTAPARVSEEVAAKARNYAQRAIEAIDGVGIFGVELFVTADEQVLINELAPRPHNSGHYTIEGCVVSQFENHIRAVMGWPLGDTSLRAPGVAMVNILGREEGSGAVENYREVLSHPGLHLHIYGKQSSRKGRKMGHITALAESPEEAVRMAEEGEKELLFAPAVEQPISSNGL